MGQRVYFLEVNMKKVLNSLPFRLIDALAIGIALGQFFGEGAMKVVVSLKYVMGQLITFCVPLIVIGFIAPSITRMGSNATKMLGISIVLAYVSSVLAAFLSTGAGYLLIPNLSIATEVEGLKALPEVVFELSIPQIMPVMSALAFSVLIGLAAVWTKSCWKNTAIPRRKPWWKAPSSIWNCWRSRGSMIPVFP